MLNKAIIIGHVGQDPKITTTKTGGLFASFSVATTERWKVRETGEKKEKTDWHRVVVFSETLVDVIRQHIKKGSKVYVDGQMTSRKWTDENGIERIASEININKRGTLVILDRKEGNPNSPPDDAYGDAD